MEFDINIGSSCRRIRSPGTPGSRREEEGGREQVELIITSIHLHWTPALFYEGASECRPTFDESPLKLAVTSGLRASIIPYAPIHHLIRTLGWAVWA